MIAADVKDRSAGYGDLQHFLQAQCLSTELNLVVIPASLSAAFEVDGIRSARGGDGRSVRECINDAIGLRIRMRGMEFDQISFADKS